LESSGKGKKDGGSSINAVADKTWAKEYFAQAEDLGLAKVADGVIAPGNNASRGDISCWLTKTFDLPQVNLNHQFKDVGASRADLSCLAATYDVGIIKGDDAGDYLRPDDAINRAEMATVIQRALNYKNKKMSGAQICTDVDKWKNLRISNIVGEVSNNGGVPIITDGKYTVKLSIDVQSEDTTTDIEGVNINVFTHDIKKISGNDYLETIKSYAVPATFKNVKIPLGKVVTVSTDIKVPVDYYITNSSGKNLLLTAAVDLPDNKILETVDLADNVATDLVWFAKNDSNEVRKIVRREIITNQMAPDAAYATTKTDKVNPYLTHREVFLRYFRGMNIANLDGMVKNCLNLRVKPGSVQIIEHKVGDGLSVEIEVHGRIEKTGGVKLPDYSGVTLYIKDDGEFKPLQKLKTWPVASMTELNGDNSNKDYSFSGRFNVKPSAEKFDLVFWVDPDKSITEYDESDNEYVQSYSLNANNYPDIEIAEFKVSNVKPFSDARSTIYGNIDLKIKNVGKSDLNDKYSLRIDYMNEDGDFVPWVYQNSSDRALISGGSLKIGETKAVTWLTNNYEKIYDKQKRYLMRATVSKDFGYEYNKVNNTKFFTYYPDGYFNMKSDSISLEGKKVGDMLTYDSLWGVWIGGQKENIKWYELPLKFNFTPENKNNNQYTGVVHIGAYHLSCDKVCKNLLDNKPGVFVNPAEASMYFTNNDTTYYLYSDNSSVPSQHATRTPIVMDDAKIEYVVYAYIGGYVNSSPTQMEWSDFYEDMNMKDNAMAVKVTVENGKLTGFEPYDINLVRKKVPEVESAFYEVK
ncbi:S-layer homology domain-containing protein, partial [Patescibacteria group bacterium]|nr:S-layer homology domain-containing protein [Patescibacteria group bacterium]